MSKVLLYIILFTNLFLGAAAQDIISSKVLKPAGKKLGKFSAFGVKSAVKGAGIGNNYALTSSIEFTDANKQGFVIRQDKSLIRYDNDFNKIWETELLKLYGLQAVPLGNTYATEKETYFIEYNRKMSLGGFREMRIVHIDINGKMKEKEYPINIKSGGRIYAAAHNDDFYTILYEVLNDQVKYYLIKVSADNLSISKQLLDIEMDNYQLSKIRLTKNSAEYGWHVLDIQADKLILEKNYVKTEKNKDKIGDLVMQTLEMDFEGNISAVKSYYPELAKQTQYTKPVTRFDGNSQELYLVGGLTEDKSIETIYIMKYHYPSSDLIYNKKLSIDELAKKIPEGENISKYRSFFNSFIFGNASFFYSWLDNDNQFINMQLFADTKGVLNIEVTLLGLKLDKYGDLIEINEVVYPHNPSLFYEYELTPKSFEIFWKAEGREHLGNLKSSPTDFINSYAGKVNPKFLVWAVFSRKEFDIVISARESDGEIKAYKTSK